MTAVLANELRDATARSLEELAFMMLEPLEPGALPVDEAVALDVTGPVSGRFVLGLSSRLLPELAANMLGEDAPLPVEQQRDALRELANVICGAFLPALASASASFRIAPGVACDFAAETRSAGSSATFVDGGVDGGRVALIWSPGTRP